MRSVSVLAAFCLLLPCFAAAQAPPAEEGKAEVVLRSEKAGAPRWSLAIHGGAGTIPKDIPESERDAYLASLRKALEIGRDALAGGGTSLDAVEKVVRFLEDDPLFNAGKGAVYTHAG